MATFSLCRYLILLLLGTFFAAAVYAQPADQTKGERAKGSDVVRAVIARILTSEIFSSDQRLLRRIAYVESNDGNDPNTFRSDYFGGIWQVDELEFSETQVPELAQKHEAIQREFEIDWANVEWSDLQKPLYSGLAARLYLCNIPDPIPTSSDIPGQARYWKDNYNEEGNEQKFIDDAVALEEKEACTINADIVFLLDESGSIRRTDFDKVREFIYNFASPLKIGPSDNQVGVLVFSSSTSTIFDLGTYGNKENLLDAILAIPHGDGTTNTAAGLRRLINSGFTVGAGARIEDRSIIRIAIVLTDGKSDNFDATISAAAELHAFRPAVLVYAIGVGGNTNDEELHAIAGATGNVDHIASFSAGLFQLATDELSYQLCNTASIPVDSGEVINGNLNLGDDARYQFTIPSDGLTFSIDVDSGRIIFYTSSTITNPNEAFHDNIRVCDAETGSHCDIFIEPTNPGSSNATDEPVFVTIEGADTNNTFTIDSSPGDTAEGPLDIFLYNDSPRIIEGINKSIEVDFVLSRPASSVMCTVGLQPQFDCSSGRAVFNDVPPGRYVLRVEAKLREHVTVKSRKIEINSDPSYCTLHFINEGVVMREQGTASIEFTSNGPAQSFTCQLNVREAVFPCTSPVELTGLAEGEHRLKVIPRGCGSNRRAMNIFFTI